MNLHHFRLSVTFLFSLTLSCLIYGCASRAVINDDLDALLGDLEKKSYMVGQFRADFHKIRKSPLFSKEMVVKGVLIAQKENRFQLTLSGDINVEILSDGQFLTIIHNGTDEEFYYFRGERDRSKFSDPLMAMINTITGGDVGKFANVNKTTEGNLISLQIQPGVAPEFERMQDVWVDLSESGMIKKVVINFKNGSQDTTVFDSWFMLTQDDPSIAKMNARLEHLARRFPSGILPGSTRLESHKSDDEPDYPDGVYKKPVHQGSQNGSPNAPEKTIE